MLLIGLTGSIATGKSTVARVLQQSDKHKLPVIDADVLARQVVEPGTRGYAAIVSRFGSSVPELLLPASDALCGGQQNGRHGRGRPLNRVALGQAVFGDNDEQRRARLVLNGIVHPAVRREMARQVLRYYLAGHWAVILDVPLLFESSLHYYCGTAVVVAVTDPKVQMQRLRLRDPHLTEADAENRVLSQGNVADKAERTLYRNTTGRGFVIWNDGDHARLEQDIDSTMAHIRATSPRWWTMLCLLCAPLALSSAVWSLLQNYMLDKAWQRQNRAYKAEL